MSCMNVPMTHTHPVMPNTLTIKWNNYTTGYFAWKSISKHFI